MEVRDRQLLAVVGVVLEFEYEVLEVEEVVVARQRRLLVEEAC